RAGGIMRVLVAGGAGFIGSHVCRELLFRGHDVICLDNLSTGSEDNIDEIDSHRDFAFIREDVTRTPALAVDLVLHLASPASPLHYQQFPIETMMANSAGTHRLLALAADRGARFVFASTSEVYGDPLEHPQTEAYWGNVNPVGPRGVYDEAKRFAEAITMAYHRYHGLDTKIVRIFNTYGPRMRIKDGRAVPNFIAQALRNEDVTIFGSGQQTRSFCYISDLVRGILALMASSENEPVNIGNPHEMSIRD